MMNIVNETETEVLVNLNGLYFWSRIISPDAEFCDCMNCHKLIGDDIPIRFFLYGGKKGELVFCPACASKIGVMHFLGITQSSSKLPEDP